MVRTNPSNVEERRAVAKELASLNISVELNDSPKRYFSLDIGSRPNKNAVIIPKSAQFVSFFIEDQSLVEKLKGAGFSVEAFPEDPKRLFNKNKHKVFPLTVSLITNHKTLIIEVLTHSLNVITSRKAKSN
jgi:hypothetical protein